MSLSSIKVALSVYRDAKKGHDMQFVVRQGTLWLVRRPKKGAMAIRRPKRGGSSTFADRKEDYLSGSSLSEKGGAVSVVCRPKRELELR